MNNQNVSIRLSDVLNVDSINSTQADFLSTHIPFRKITVTNDLSGTPTLDYISEDDIFNRYFADSSKSNQHELIVVDGSSGSGKSHFIRWIEAKLSTEAHQNDVVLMIRRSDNTLKGTIKQFLNIEEVKNIRNKDIYERLVKANQNVSEQKFKLEIYHKFLVEIADDVESILSTSDRKNFRELLSSSEFEERMLIAGGPIERIYSKIVDSNTEFGDDVLALFDVEDFTLDYDFNMRLKNNASKKAIKMANKLLPEDNGNFPDEDCNPEKLVNYMNSKVENVVKACAGLEPGDFQQIFKEIRQELYSQGKNLILLIEDITSCTGINRDLLDALIVKHTGENAKDKMCRLKSVIGTTSEYFKEFRSNYLDRITMTVTIEDGTIGNTIDDLIQFIAKYLNVMSLSKEEVDKWYRDGAVDSEYPIHEETEVTNWDSYNYNGKKISLYPFTKKAIVNLYRGLDVHKTPRNIIRKIIEPAVSNICQDKEVFPKFMFSKKPNLKFEVIDRVRSTISNMQLAEEDKEILTKKAFSILGYWGDGTLDNSKKEYIGGIHVTVLKEFGLGLFAEKITGIKIEESGNFGNDVALNEDNICDNNLIQQASTPKPESKPIVNKHFEDFTKILSEWHYDKKSFTKAYQVRDLICEFIFTSISWQQEGVPLISIQKVKDSSYDLVEIKRQDRKVGNGLVMLEDTDETFQLLLAIGKSYHIGKKTWNFENAASSLRIATSWLEKNKKKFVNVVKNYDNKKKYPDYLRCAIVAEVYRGVLNGDYCVNKLSDIKTEALLKNRDNRQQQSMVGHSKEWAELVSFMYSSNIAETNIDTVQRYFNLIQGNVINATKKYINYVQLENMFKELKASEFDVIIDDIESDKISPRNESRDYLKKILIKSEKVVFSELKEGKQQYKAALEYFGFPNDTEIETEDIKDLLNEIIDFYKDTETYGVNITLRTDEAIVLRNKSVEIAKALSIVSMDSNNMSILEKIILYANNPMKIISDFLNFISQVEEDNDNVNSQIKDEKEALTRGGKWSDDVDPRFSQYELKFNELISRME